MISYYSSIILIYPTPSEKTKNNSEQQTDTYYRIHHHEIPIFNSHTLPTPFVVLVVAFHADVADWTMMNVVATWSELTVDQFALFTKFESEIVFL